MPPCSGAAADSSPVPRSALGALFASSAQAATTYTVTTNGDDNPAVACTATTNQCATLRDAIAAANTDGGADTITFAPGVTGTITLTNGALPVTGAGGLTITGPGAGSLAVSGNNASQVFTVTAARTVSVAIDNLTIEDGSGAQNGGAVANGAALTLAGDTIKDSTTTRSGGGVYSSGPLTLSQSTVSGNTAPTGGAAENRYFGSGGRGDLTVGGSTISGNQGGANSFGGGLLVDGYVTGSLDVSDSTISGRSPSLP